MKGELLRVTSTQVLHERLERKGKSYRRRGERGVKIKEGKRGGGGVGGD